MMTVTNGLVSLDPAISTLCCNALDSIATACHQNRTRTKPDPELMHLIQLMDHCEGVFLKVRQLYHGARPVNLQMRDDH
jgi:hypothetical protein